MVSSCTWYSGTQNNSPGGVELPALLVLGLGRYEKVHDHERVRVSNSTSPSLPLPPAPLRSCKVLNVHAEPWSILAVTFTKKAAEEMRSRVRSTLGDEISSRVTLGTFHSVCARLLRRYGEALPGIVPGLNSGFSIFDTEDSRRMLTEIMKDIGDESEVILTRIGCAGGEGGRAGVEGGRGAGTGGIGSLRVRRVGVAGDERWRCGWGRNGSS